MSGPERGVPRGDDALRGRTGARGTRRAAVAAAVVVAAGAGAFALPYLPMPYLPIGDAICPAIGYSAVVEVRLDEAWPDRDALELAVRLPDGAGAGRGAAPGPVWKGSATSVPRTADVVVTRAGDVVHTGTVTLTSRVVDRPHGPRCPGPTLGEAVVRPPARS